MSSSDESSSDSYDKIKYKIKSNHSTTIDSDGSSTVDDYDEHVDTDQWSESSRDISSDESNDISSTDSTEDDEDVLDTGDNIWVKGQLNSSIPNFKGTFGLSKNVYLPSSSSPIDIFFLFLTPDIVKFIVDQSNLYRTQHNLKVEPMNEEDFYRLLGFLFYSSLVKLPCKGDYWSPKSIQQIISNTISRNRVDQLLRMLDFNDNTLATNRYSKVQQLIDVFNERCGVLVDQEEFISIDEQMVAYKGKTSPPSLKQYMPKKPSRYGFKLWCKCGVTGYVYKIDLYKGGAKAANSTRTAATTTLQRRTRLTDAIAEDEQRVIQRKADVKSLGIGGMVVMDMVKNDPKGTKIFVNNYFGSFSLMKKMVELGYGIVCTLKQNRIGGCPLPSDKYLKKKNRGYYDYRLTNDKKCIIVVWKDSKRVLIGSNFVGIDPIVESSRWNKIEKKKVNVPTPQIIKIYNQFMGGVDTADMLCALHSIPFRSKKWYIRLVWRVFDLMVLNSWLIWRHIFGNDSNWRMKRIFQFKLDVARALLQTHLFPLKSIILSAQDGDDDSNESDDESQGHTLPQLNKPKLESKLTITNSSRYDGYKHWPVFKPTKYPLRCKYEDCKQRTQWMCSKCRVHLCIKPKLNCFMSFHNKT